MLLVSRTWQGPQTHNCYRWPQRHGSVLRHKKYSPLPGGAFRSISRTLSATCCLRSRLVCSAASKCTLHASSLTSKEPCWSSWALCHAPGHWDSDFMKRCMEPSWRLTCVSRPGPPPSSGPFMPSASMMMLSSASPAHTQLEGQQDYRREGCS